MKRVSVIVLVLLINLHIVVAAELITTITVAGNWQPQYQAYGQVTAAADSHIRLPFAVRITDSAIVPGQTLRKGAVMLRFDAPDLHQALTAYRDARLKARLSAQRLSVLRSNRKANTLTRKELLGGEQDLAAEQAAATAAWNQLQTKLAVLASSLDRNRVDKLLGKDKLNELQYQMSALHAPFGGVLITRPPAVGAWVDKGETLLELEDLHRVYVQVGVTQARLADWQGGDTRLLKDTRRLKLMPLPGAPGLDPQTGLRLLRYVADNSETESKEQLRDGEWAQILHQGVPRMALWLPEASVVSRNGKAWVVLVADDNTLHPLAVKTGPAEQGRVPVLAGLKPDQPVLVEDAYEWLYRDLKDLIRFVD